MDRVCVHLGWAQAIVCHGEKPPRADVFCHLECGRPEIRACERGYRKFERKQFEKSRTDSSAP